jgi:hypothetical protein
MVTGNNVTKHGLQCMFYTHAFLNRINHNITYTIINRIISYVHPKITVSTFSETSEHPTNDSSLDLSTVLLRSTPGKPTDCSSEILLIIMVGGLVKLRRSINNQEHTLNIGSSTKKDINKCVMVMWHVFRY